MGLLRCRYTVFEFLGFAAVLTNCALIGFTSQILRVAFNLDDFGLLLMVVIIEHVLLLLKFCAAKFVPDAPAWVLKTQDYQRRREQGIKSSKVLRPGQLKAFVNMGKLDEDNDGIQFV